MHHATGGEPQWGVERQHLPDRLKQTPISQHETV